MLWLEDVHVRRAGTHALRGVSLTVERGEIVALIGANGAGKTTTLATISGLLRPESGRIRYQAAPDSDPIDLTRLPAEQVVSAGISHCPEGRQVFAALTVAENLRIGAYLRRDRSEIARDAEAIEAQFPILRERARIAGDKLSGGEQMMLVIGRALMSRPRLLLLDEPSLGLAPLLVERVFEILERLRREGMTILLVEQNAGMALEIADRGYVIETGKIVLTGPGRDLATNANVRRAYLGAA